MLPGAYGGQMGPHRDPFFIEASPYGNPFWRGAYPEFTFPQLPKKPPESSDDRVFQAFVKTVGIYPVGTLVRLEGGRLAVVIEHNECALLKPIVKVFYSISSQSRITPRFARR